MCGCRVRAIPHNSKCRYGERGAADAKPKAQIILDAAKVSAASGGNSEPKQGQRSQSARGFCPRSTMRVPQPDIIEHFGNADAVPQPPERCLSRQAGIVRCCLRASPLGEKLSAKRTDVGRVCPDSPLPGGSGKVCPHPSAGGAADTFPQGGRRSQGKVQLHRAVVGTIDFRVDFGLLDSVGYAVGNAKIIDAPAGVFLPGMKAIGPPGICSG